MAGNGQETTPADSLNTLRAWTMTDGLQKDLCIEGVDIGSGRQGFRIELQVGWVVGFTGSLNLTMRVKDDQTTIAEETFPTSGFPGGQGSVWNLNFTAGRSSCTVLKGHRLAVEVVATPGATGTASATIGNIRGAHLGFQASDAMLPTVRTENADGAADVFFPNDIAGSREVRVNGTLNNAFTDAFVDEILFNVTGPNASLVYTAAATLSGGNYSAVWSYPPSPPGPYTVHIEVRDSQGHSYNASALFTMASYGLRINTQGAANGSATRYTTQGSCAAYDLVVSNVGGQATSVSMLTDTPVPALWTASFSRTSLSLEPGADDTSTFSVCPDAQVGPGNSTLISVLALSTTDPGSPKARAPLATTTIIEREIALSIAPPSTSANVKLGAVASYEFTLTNNGGLATDVLLNATQGANGWGRALSSNPGLVEEAGGWRLPGLGAYAVATLTLAVQAPSAATPDTTFACVVSAKSAENASAVATFTGTTHLVLGIELVQTSLPVSPEVGPAGFVDFQFEATNTDPLNDHTVAASDVTVSEAGTPQMVDGVDGGSIAIQPPIGCCARATSQVLTVTVQLPAHARAGTYAFTLWVVYDGDPEKFAFLNFTLRVSQVTDYYLRIVDNPSQVVLKGTASTRIPAFIVSESNYDVSVDLTPDILQAGIPDGSWTVRILGAGDVEISLRMLLRAYAEVPINISVAAAPSAWNGEHRDFVFKISLALSGAHPVNLEPPLDLVVELDSMTVFARMWQQSLFIVLLFLLLAVGAAGMARTALRGRRPPAPAPPPRPPAGGKKPPAAPVKSAAGPPKP
jgi:hypothetical protein